MVYQTAGMDKKDYKSVSLRIPPIIFGTSSLGNLFVALDDDAKHEIVMECVRKSSGIVVLIQQENMVQVLRWKH